VVQRQAVEAAIEAEKDVEAQEKEATDRPPPPAAQ
jgi:hypothetical protein